MNVELHVTPLRFPMNKRSSFLDLGINYGLLVDVTRVCSTITSETRSKSIKHAKEAKLHHYIRQSGETLKSTRFLP
jgi:D-ribose pyranose/furanose isomerase RbsD